MFRKAEKGLATVQKNFSDAKNMQFDSRIISYGNFLFKELIEFFNNKDKLKYLDLVLVL